MTTVVGLLGTDGISRSTENLVAKAKALKEEGISAYCCCGAYGHPGPTITGSISRDIMFVDEIIGLKLAVSDHRAPNITVDELIRLGSDVRTAGMLSGKAGFVCLHMGGDDRALSPVFEALEHLDPCKDVPAHPCGKSKKLQEDAFKLAKMGGTIDFTCGQFEEKIKRAGGILRAAKEAGGSHGQGDHQLRRTGSWSNYDAAGNLTEMGVSSVDTMYRQVVYRGPE